MKKYMLILLVTLLSVGVLHSAEPKQKQIKITVDVPLWAKYKTTDADGTVTVWPEKPFLITTDGTPSYTFWVTESGFRYTFIGGAINKHWRKSLRRIR
jgi:hypothetical protein